MKYWFLVKKIFGASYLFKYFSLSAAFFVLVLIPQPFLRGFCNLIRLCSQEAAYLFTAEKTARKATNAWTVAETENSLCDSMTDGQVTLSATCLGSWDGQHFTQHFWGMEITQAAPARVCGCPKLLLLSSFLFSAKLVCPGNTSWRKYTELVAAIM